MAKSVSAISAISCLGCLSVSGFWTPALNFIIARGCVTQTKFHAACVGVCKGFFGKLSAGGKEKPEMASAPVSISGIKSSAFRLKERVQFPDETNIQGWAKEWSLGCVNLAY